MKYIFKIALAILSLSIAHQSFAGLIYDVQGDQLVGVSGIEYNGQVWSVEFGHSCETMYSGCADSSLFAFTTSAGAEGALLALYNQAINDDVTVDGVTYNFDSQTNLTYSIGRVNFAEIWVPFATNGSFATSVWGYHRDGVNDLVIADRNANWAIDYGFNGPRGAGDRDYMFFTRWSTQSADVIADIPEPTMFSIMGLGLLTLLVRRRKV